MDVILESDDVVAAKDRLYRALDKAIEYKNPGKSSGKKMARSLSEPTANCYFANQAGEVTLAAHGYSRDHGADVRQIILALVVRKEGFPLS